MSVELVAVLVTSLLEVTGLVVMYGLLYRTRVRIEADHAALYLQGKRVEGVLREMRGRAGRPLRSCVRGRDATRRARERRSDPAC